MRSKTKQFVFIINTVRILINVRAFPEIQMRGDNNVPSEFPASEIFTFEMRPLVTLASVSTLTHPCIVKYMHYYNLHNDNYIKTLSSNLRTLHENFSTKTFRGALAKFLFILLFRNVNSKLAQVYIYTIILRKKFGQFVRRQRKLIFSTHIISIDSKSKMLIFQHKK